MKTLLAFLILMVSFIRPIVVLAESTPLRLGIMPFNSTLALIKTHQSLREHLQRSLGRQVDIYTAADYRAFLNESLAGEYDLLITGPHFGVMCLDKGYQALVHYRTSLRPILVVSRTSGFTGHEDLRGKKIGLSNRLSVSSIVGLEWLESKGLKADDDFTVLVKTTHGAAIAGVAVGDLDAALTTYTPLKQVPEDIRARVTDLPTDVSVPHLMTLAHQRLGGDTIERVRESLLSFQNTPQGEEFFTRTGYIGYDPIEPHHLEALEPYVPLIKRLMQ